MSLEIFTETGNSLTTNNKTSSSQPAQNEYSSQADDSDSFLDDNVDDDDLYQMIPLSSISCNRDTSSRTFHSTQDILTRIYHVCFQRSNQHGQNEEDHNHVTSENNHNQEDQVGLLWKFLSLPWKIFTSSNRRTESYKSFLNLNRESDFHENEHNDSKENSDHISKQNDILGIPNLNGYDTINTPFEAHILARFWLASTLDSTSSTMPFVRVFRPGTHLYPNRIKSIQPIHVLVMVGWGLIVEYRLSHQDDHSFVYGKNKETVTDPDNVDGCLLSETTDAKALLDQAYGNRESPLLPSIALVRCCEIYPNLIAVSWGLDDGIIVLYKKITMTFKATNKNSSTKPQQHCWESIAILTPTQETVEATYHELKRYTNETSYSNEGSKRPRLWSNGKKASSQDDLQYLFESGLMRVSDISPITMGDYPCQDNQKEDATSSNIIVLTVSRIGGCIEIFVIPLDIFDLSYNSKCRDKSRYFSSHVHYADDLPDLTLDSRCLVTPVTHANDIHSDIMTLAMYPRYDESECNFILACVGGKKNNDVSSVNVERECISYWSISFKVSPNGDDSALALDIVLMDYIDVKEKGPPVTVFARIPTKNTWIQDRVGSKKRSVNVSSSTTVILSTSPPICSLRFHECVASATDEHIHLPRLLLSIMDFHGGISLLNCSDWLSRNLNSTASSPFLPYFVMERERSLSVFCPFVDFTRVVEYSVAYLNIDEIVLTACTSAQIIVMKCLIRSDRQIEVLNVQKTLRSKTHPYRLIHGSLITDSISSKGLFLLTMIHHSDDLNFNISLQVLKRMDILSILDSYLRLDKYDKALAYIERQGSQFFSNDIRDNIYKHLWEYSGDLTSLSKVSDARYFIENLINLHDFVPDDKMISLNDLLHLHRDALEKYTLVYKADTIFSQKVDHSLWKILQSRYWCIHTLTYLPEDIERSITSQTFLLLDHLNYLIQIAKDLARIGEVRTLSIILARHWIQLGSNSTRIKILSRLPYSIDVSLYAHLLPCYGEQSPYAWKPYDYNGSESPSRIFTDANGSHMTAYVEKLFNIDLRGAIVDELCAPSFVEDVTGIDVMRWYLERAKAMFQYTCQLDMVHKFCDCIGSRLSFCLNDKNPDLVKMWNEVLSLRVKSHRSLTLVLYESLNRNIDDRMPVSQLIDIDLASLKRFSSAAHEFLMLPFFKQIIPISVTSLPFATEARRIEVSDITRFAINELKTSQYCHTLDNGDLSWGLELCVKILNSSSSSLPLSERIIHDDKMLSSFIIEVCSIMESKALSPSLVSILWNLIDSIPPNVNWLNSFCLNKIDQNLLIIELLLRWVDPHPNETFTLSSIEGATLQDLPTPGSTRKTCSFGYHFADKMSHGFFRKISTTSYCNHRRLLLQFLADVMDLNEKCFDFSLSIEYIIEEFVFRRAMNDLLFSVIREIMLMPTSFIRHEVLCSYLCEFIKRIASRGVNNEIQHVAKDLRDLVGAFAAPLLLDEVDNFIHYFDYCIFLWHRNEDTSMVMSFEDFRIDKPIGIVRNLLTSNFDYWVRTHPEWSDPSVAADLCRDLFSALHNRDGFDRIQVENHRHFFEKALSRLMTLFGPLSPRNSILLKCMWIKAAAEGNFFGVANAASCILVHEIISMKNGDNLWGSCDEFTSIIDTISLTLSMLVERESMQDRCVLYEIHVEFLHWCVAITPLTEHLQLDRLIRSLRTLEVNTTTAFFADSFRAYQCFMLQITSSSSTYGDCDSRRMDEELSDGLIDACVRQCFTQKDDGLCTLSLAMLLEAIGVFRLKDFPTFDKLLDNKLRSINDVVNDKYPFFIRFSRLNVAADEGIVKQLLGYGYSLFGARKAALYTENRSFRDALSWAVEHSNESSFNDPMVMLESTESTTMDIGSIYHLLSHLTLLRRSGMSRPIAFLREPGLKVVKGGSISDISDDEQKEVRSLRLVEMKLQLKNLGESERLRLKNEAIKLLEIARKAKGV